MDQIPPLGPLLPFKGTRGCQETSTSSRLPSEIEDRIIYFLIHERQPGWSRYAAVSKRWQATIEKQNFSRLKLGSACLADLGRIVTPRSHLVRQIWLNIKIPDFIVGLGSTMNDLPAIDEMFGVVNRSLCTLFSSMGAWEPAGSLTLELSAYADTDAVKWCSGGGNCDAGEWQRRLVHNRKSMQGCDPIHWGGFAQHDSTKPVPPDMYASRLVRTFTGHLCRAPAVTKFVVRRHLRRGIPYTLLRSLVEAMPRLEEVVYEPWRAWHEENWLEYINFSEVLAALPARVKSVTVFEDFQKWIESRRHIPSNLLVRMNDSPLFSSLEHQLREAFARRSQDLEHLSVAHMISAEGFFDSSSSDDEWPRLKSLRLSSPTLTRRTDPKKIGQLLRRATSFIRRMPRLESLILWNGQRREAGAIMFHRNPGTREASVTWRGTWDLEIPNHVVKAWQRSVPESYTFRSTNERLQRAHLESHGDAIHHLGLSGVVDPVSLWQIRTEGSKFYPA